MDPQIYGQIFEAIMMATFGASWPMQIIKTLRTKNPLGKSFSFLWLILSGYLAGIASKIVLGQFMKPVTILYVANAAMVATDLIFSYYYLSLRKKDGTFPAAGRK